MNIRVLRFVWQDIADACSYYDNNKAGLSDEFTQQVERALALVLQFPLAAPAVTKRLRKKRIGQFPYSIVYRADPDMIVVFGIVAEQKQPDYWLNRRES